MTTVEQEEMHEAVARHCVELEQIRGSFGLHAGHWRKVVPPHWIVCSCGKRAIIARRTVRVAE